MTTAGDHVVLKELRASHIWLIGIVLMQKDFFRR
jgi:hypothetical protein